MFLADTSGNTGLILFLLLTSALALFPAYFAKRAGRGSGAWFVYGFLVWPIAMIHIAFVMLGQSARPSELVPTQPCPSCGELNPRGDRFCPHCGTNMETGQSKTKTTIQERTD